MLRNLTSRFPLLLLSCGLVTALMVEPAIGSAVQYDRTATDEAITEQGPEQSQENPRAASLEERITNDGAVRLDREQATAHLSGKTQQWANGGAYFHPDGRLDYIWEGKEFSNFSWDVSRKGLVCIQRPDGFNTSCSLYFAYKDTVWTVVTEVFGERRQFFGGPDTVVDGNQLSELEPWDPALSGN